MRLEDLLSKDVIQSVRKIVASDDWSFNTLVEISGLSPTRDFRYVDLAGMDLRGADLRGFDLTGADLRGCLKDDRTEIDVSTVLDDADIDWIEEPSLSIVEKMFEVERASSHAARAKAISDLVTQFNSDRHTHQYFRNLIRDSDSIDLLFDVLNYFEPETDLDREIVTKALINFALRSVRKKSPRGTATRSTTGFTNFFSRLQESKNKYIDEIIIRYLEKSIADGRVSINPDKYEVTEDFERLLEAFVVASKVSDLLTSQSSNHPSSTPE